MNGARREAEETALPGEPPEGDSAGPPPAVRPIWKRRRVVVGVVIAIVVVWIAASAVDVLIAARHVRQGSDQIQDARSSLSAGGLLSGAPLAPLRAAEASFSSARSLLSSPLLWPIDVVPVLGRQLRSVQDLAVAAGNVSRTGVTTVGQTKALLKLPHTAGPDRITALQRLAKLASTTHASLSHVNLGPSDALIGPLARQRAKFSTELGQVQTTLARTAAAATAAAAILKGPQNYLLLTANNAEMRSGSGAFLEAGVLSTSNGSLQLGGLQPSWALTLPPGAVHVTGNLEARWGWLLPGEDWRNLGLTPQFAVNGALAARMWKADTGQQVDGVIELDVAGLADLLSATGPVTTSSGSVVSAASVDQLLLHDQYVGEVYTGISQHLFEPAREDQLGTLASAIMHALQTQPLDLHAVVDALSGATAGRHLMLWSADPSTEAIWQSTGVSGQLTGDSLLTAVINRGANKLDQYLDMSSSLTLEPHGDATAATLKVTLANHTPSGQSPFIAGPSPEVSAGVRYGEYLGIVTANLPDDTRDLSLGAKERAAVDGQEGPTLLAGVNVDLLPGATRTITFRFSLPGVHGMVDVVPSARIPPQKWDVDGTKFTDKSFHKVTW